MARIRTLAELQSLAASFLDTLRPHSDQATLIGLSGELGAGKTAFVKALATTLGVPDMVTSPTFVLEKIYKVAKGPFAHLVHIDAYRLESQDELKALGWKEIVGEPGNLVVVEWPERLGDAFPKDSNLIRFRFIDEETRDIEL